MADVNNQAGPETSAKSSGSSTEASMPSSGAGASKAGQVSYSGRLIPSESVQVSEKLEGVRTDVGAMGETIGRLEKSLDAVGEDAQGLKAELGQVRKAVDELNARLQTANIIQPVLKKKETLQTTVDELKAEIKQDSTPAQPSSAILQNWGWLFGVVIVAGFLVFVLLKLCKVSKAVEKGQGDCKRDGNEVLKCLKAWQPETRKLFDNVEGRLARATQTAEGANKELSAKMEGLKGDIVRAIQAPAEELKKYVERCECGIGQYEKCLADAKTTIDELNQDIRIGMMDWEKKYTEAQKKCEAVQEDLRKSQQRENELSTKLADYDKLQQELAAAKSSEEAAKHRLEGLADAERTRRDLQELKGLCLGAGLGDDVIAGKRLGDAKELSEAKPVLFLRLMEVAHRLSAARHCLGGDGVDMAVETLQGVDALTGKLLTGVELAAWREKAQPILQEWSQGLCRLEWPKVGTAYDSKFHARQKGSDVDETVIKAVNRGYIVDMRGMVLSAASVRT